MNENKPQEKLFKHHRNGGPPRPTPTALAGEVIFRIVCHISVVGGVVGRAGRIVQKLQSQTSCRIHCQEQASGAQHRVILILGSSSLNRKIWLSESEVCDLSCAQEAMLRVFERIWEVEEETNLGTGSQGEEAFCGLLAHTTQIGAIVGKNGKTITNIREKSGASVIILPPPSCARKDDELIQITGNSLAVMRALIEISGLLQDCPPTDRSNVTVRMNGSVVRGRASGWAEHNPHAGYFPQLYSFLPPISSHSASAGKGSNARLSVANADGDFTQEANDKHREVVFRLLFSNNIAGGIIGKRGAVVRALENEAGASIMFEPSLTESGERIVTISSLEELESLHSPSQNAVVLVFARSIETEIEKGHGSCWSKDFVASIRLLVNVDEVTCLTENGGRVLSDMIEDTETDIQILEDGTMSDWFQANVVKITGEYQNVQNAIFQVTARLRNRLFSVDEQNEMKTNASHERGRQLPAPGEHQLTRLLRGNESEATMSQSQTTGSIFTIAITEKQITSDGSSKPKKSLLDLLPHRVCRGSANNVISSQLDQLSLTCDKQENVIGTDEMTYEMDNANGSRNGESESWVYNSCHLK